MGDMDLLVCMIETEINKLKYQQRIAIRNGQANKIKAITNKIWIKLLNKLSELIYRRKSTV